MGAFLCWSWRQSYLRIMNYLPFLLWWRVRAKSFLCLCFLIFFLLFFTTLPNRSPPIMVFYILKESFYTIYFFCLYFFSQAISKTHLTTNYRVASLFKMLTYPHVCCAFSSARALSLNVIYIFETACGCCGFIQHRKPGSLPQVRDVWWCLRILLLE